MNSDKFDRIVLDLLYGELDELTAAAAKRHMEQSARAREIFLHFKATRQLSVLPTHSPPLDFELGLMERERGALAELPVYHRIGRIISMLAGYAMRPQLIMGALLLLMIGSSLMFLRTRPGQHSAVLVTERGAPEADVDLVLPVPAAAANLPSVDAHGIFQSPAPPESGGSPAHLAEGARAPLGTNAEKPIVRAEASAEGLDPFDQAIRMYREGQYIEAQRRFERISRTGGLRAAEAALYSAQAVRNVSGCAPAVSRFDRVRLRFPGSGSAYEAAWRAAKCLLQLGDVEAARQNYESLLQVASYGERARAALATLSGVPGAANPSATPTGERATEVLPVGTSSEATVLARTPVDVGNLAAQQRDGGSQEPSP
jgi:TolA-binding protein